MSASTYTGRVVGTPTIHHVTSMGNAAKQFIVVTEGVNDARVLVTAGNASIGYTIGNSDFRALPHVFHLNARGKVTHAVPVEPEMTSKYARDLVAGDVVTLTTGRVVALHGVRWAGDRRELAYATPDGAVEWHEGVAWDTRWTVMGQA